MLPILFQSPMYSEQNLIDRSDIIQVTLVRDPMGLGFSIAGGKGAEAYIEGSESVYISKIAEGGPASRDGKLQVGDRLVQVGIVLLLWLLYFYLKFGMD